MYQDGSLFFVFFILFYVGILVVSLVAMAFWIWMLVDCVTKEPSDGNDKTTWTLVIALTGAIGALIYYFVRRPERIRVMKWREDQWRRSQGPRENPQPPTPPTAPQE